MMGGPVNRDWTTHNWQQSTQNFLNVLSTAGVLDYIHNGQRPFNCCRPQCPHQQIHDGHTHMSTMAHTRQRHLHIQFIHCLMHLKNAKFDLFGHLANLVVNRGWLIVTVLQTKT